MTPRNARLNSSRSKSQLSNQFLTTEALPASLARVENYENEFPYVDLQDMGNLYENIRNAPTNTYRTPPRHNPPRCCDVPALQSPKNAVAPTQTLIATSNSGTDYANSIQRMKNVLADQQSGMATKKELENNKINQISQEDKASLTTSPTSIRSVSIHNGQTEASSSRNISHVTILNGLENSNDCAAAQTIYLNGLNNMASENNIVTMPHISGVQTVMSQNAQSFVYTKNNQNTGANTTNTNITHSNSSHPQSGQGAIPFNKNGIYTSAGIVSPACSYQFPENINQCFESSCLQCLSKYRDPKCHVCYEKLNPSNVNAGTAVVNKFDEIRFIDDEIRDDMETSEQLRGVHRTPTVISISPMCSNDSIVRSCSVGYLDLVDAQLVPCDVALKMLRKDAPNKRLVLVSRKTKRRKKNKPPNDVNQQNSKTPRLRNCGKSKSLDSSDIFPSNEQIAFPPQLLEHIEEAAGASSSEILEEKCNESIEQPKTMRRENVADKCEKTDPIPRDPVREKSNRLEALASPAR